VGPNRPRTTISPPPSEGRGDPGGRETGGRGLLLLVVLDRVGRTDRCLPGVRAGCPAGPPLPE
jgi:hypothetical protein